MLTEQLQLLYNDNKRKLITETLQHKVLLYNGNKRKLNIGEIHTDQEFKFAQNVLTDLDIKLVPVPAGKHQPHVKRTTWTLKECYRAMYH